MRCSSAKSPQPVLSWSLKGSRCRSTSTVRAPPTATSICGMRSGRDMPSTRVFSTGIRAETCGRQNRAGIHHGDVAAVLLAKADQRTALACHGGAPKGAHAGVCPGKPAIGGKSCSASAAQCATAHPPARAAWPPSVRQVKMLHRAAAAGSEMRATRHHPLARRLAHRQDAAPFRSSACAGSWSRRRFTGQGALDEHRLAVDVRNAASFVIQRFDHRNRHLKSRSHKKGRRL
jgi:hypothetical protein